MADLAAGKARVLEAADMRENRFALAEQALRQRRCGLGQTVRVGLQHLEHAGRACGDGLAPARAVLGRDRLRREAVDIMTCQRVMQLGGAPADLPHALQHRGHLGRLGGDFVGQQALLVDQPVERGAGDAPGIALVFDEAMHDASAVRVSPSTSSTVPSSAGAFLKCATSARKRPISISGWMPGVTLRKILTTYLLSTTTLVFDCSRSIAWMALISGGGPSNAVVGRNSISGRRR